MQTLWIYGDLLVFNEAEKLRYKFARHFSFYVKNILVISRKILTSCLLVFAS